MNYKNYFSIISSESEEQANGYVECIKGNKTIVYQDPLFEVYWTHSFPFTRGKLHDVITENAFDPAHWTDGFQDNEFGIYTFEKFTFLINPQGITESFLSTLIRWDIYNPHTYTSEFPRQSVGELFERIFGCYGEFFRDSPNTAHLIASFDGENEFTLGMQCDAELMDAIERVVCRFAGITRGIVVNPTIDDLPMLDENGNPVLIIRECYNDGVIYYDAYLFNNTICFYEQSAKDCIQFFKRNYWWGTEILDGYSIVVVSMSNEESRHIEVLEQRGE